MCCVNATYFGSFGSTVKRDLDVESFSSPSGVMCRLKFNFEPALISRPDSGGKTSAALPIAYSFRNAPVGSSSSSIRFVVAWWITL